MENVKANMAKKKKTKIVLSYFGLVFLVILLFTPMIFRIVFKDRVTKKKADVASKLICSKGVETINATFLNGVPQRIVYTIPGNYMENVSNGEEQEEQTQEEQPSNNNETSLVLTKFLGYSSLVYNEENNTSSLSFNVNEASNGVDYELIFITIERQEEYYKTQGFSCSTSTLS